MTSYLADYPSNGGTARPTNARAAVASRDDANRHSGEEKCVSGVTTVAAPVAAGGPWGSSRGDRIVAVDEGCASSGRLDGDPLCARAGEPDHHRQCGLPAIGCAPGAVFRQSEGTRCSPSTIGPTLSAGCSSRRGRRKPHPRARPASVRKRRKRRRRDAMIRSPTSSDHRPARPPALPRASRRCSACCRSLAMARSSRPVFSTSRRVRRSQKFEREHRLPVTGRLSERLLSELASHDRASDRISISALAVRPKRLHARVQSQRIVCGYGFACS